VSHTDRDSNEDIIISIRIMGLGERGGEGVERLKKATNYK